MMLTAEQRAAIMSLSNRVIEGTLWKSSEEYERDMRVVQELLSTPKPAWEITEERKTAIEYAISVIEQSDTELEDSISIDLFRAMLEEDLRSKKGIGSLPS